MANEINKFPKERQLALHHIYDTEGFQVILDVMENECIKSENEYIGTMPGDPQVAWQHAIMYAQRKFLQEVISNLDAMVADVKNVKEAELPNKRTKAQTLAEIVSALPTTEI